MLRDAGQKLYDKEKESSAVRASIRNYERRRRKDETWKGARDSGEGEEKRSEERNTYQKEVAQGTHASNRGALKGSRGEDPRTKKKEEGSCVA